MVSILHKIFTIDILMATYNGEKYLSAQIDSILKQTHANWKLLIHDDGSNDKTVDIIKEYCSKYPEKIEFIDDSIKTSGAKNNFLHLLRFSNAEYIMFCDQDDVWFEDKIELTYKKMQENEGKYPNSPLLIHTDLQVVDKNLSILHKSFIDFIGLDAKKGEKLNYLICQNCITGCTIMINKPLLKLCALIPKEALMHDWWLGLIGSCFGKIIFIDKPTLAYRQHENNTLGAKKFGFKVLLKGGRHYMKYKLNIGFLAMRQAQAFTDVYGIELQKRPEYDLFTTYAKLNHYNYFQRKYLIIKYGFWRQGFFRNMIWFLFA